LPDVRVVDTGQRMIMGATPLSAGAGVPELIGDDPAGVRVRGTVMALGVLRFSQRPMFARDKWLPALRSRVVAEAEDYVMWALPVARERAGSPAQELAADLHPALRSVVAGAWLELTVALKIGTIPPMPAWPASPVTVIGDAIHLAPGFGGNLAMRDAQILCDALVEADRGRLTLLDAIGGYEETMRRNSFRSAAEASA
jgi:2-polyprenyl-6-methoxyphenol hydroxylase-like FAD-dependent oxidoreductase